MVKPVTGIFSLVLKHFMTLFKCFFFVWASLLDHMHRILIASRAIQLRFVLKVETLLTNAFTLFLFMKDSCIHVDHPEEQSKTLAF